MALKTMKKDDKRWLDDAGNVKRLYYGLIVVCLLLVAVDIGNIVYHKHGHYSWESWIGFHGFFGFVVFVGVVLAGKQLRKILMRKEDYYDRG